MLATMSRPPPGRPPSGPPGRRARIDLLALVKALRQLQSDLEDAERKFFAAGEKAHEAAQETALLRKEIVDGGEITPLRRAARSPQEEHVMRAEAEAGASSVDVERDADGKCSVSVSGRRPFPLPPQLAALVTVLAMPGGASHDGRPGWWTRAEVATAINKQTGAGLAAGAVPRLVNKLKDRFREAGENWHLIQSNRRWGVRLALRR